jgi:protein involved in polysaccharide export with SLBB domain
MVFFRFPFVFLTLLTAVLAADGPPEAGHYRLFPRDLVRLGVQGEADVSVDRRVDGLGEIYVPLIGQVKVAGLTVAAAQTLIAKRYVEAEIFVRPEIVLTVIEYSPKEVMVLGQVSKQGKQSFPPESSGISIVEAITSAGGFTRIAKGDGVRVSRKDPRGGEQSFTVNVEKMIDGRANSVEGFLLQPGDVVFVPERAF